ncbi:unnamed protein product [Medioppia subpectinata]|uniref:Right handed beta helix domain-containing protein n=1 Tax=Medioppia subpectinata TaxID=1979941 RepID=A0A7R9PW11_9ACAR|nr:unnamed protein product [Medioppia subpectinata]CAG2102830.1 unnamed protein product [Medioppia subpectinata]
MCEFVMNPFITLLLYSSAVYYGCVESRAYLATTSRQLRDYLRIVSPGDTIQLRDGYYSGSFVANRIGRANAPIRLVGSARAVLSNRGGTGLYLTGQYWHLRGFTVSGCRRGIAIQNGKNNLLERVSLRNMDEEGVTIRQDSDANTIRSCIIYRTGIRAQQNGYGIVIGSDYRQGFRGYVDRSDGNVIVNNNIQTGAAAEAVHVKAGTCCGAVRENVFDGRAITVPNNVQAFNRLWVSVNGNNYQIDRNSGRTTAADGFRVRMSDDIDGLRTGGESGSDRDYNSDDDNNIEIQGCGNRFSGNRCEANTNGYCIRVINPNRCRIAIYSDNTVAGGIGLSNVGLTNL